MEYNFLSDQPSVRLTVCPSVNNYIQSSIKVCLSAPVIAAGVEVCIVIVHDILSEHAS